MLAILDLVMAESLGYNNHFGNLISKIAAATYLKILNVFAGHEH